MALHKRILLGVFSKSTIMVEPVVVIPDILSKKAFTNESLGSDSKKGKLPKIAILNQDNVVSRKACCKFSFLFSSKFVRTKSIPIKAVIDAEGKKALLFSSYIICIKNGISINAPNIIRSTPTTKNTVLLLFIFGSEVI